MRSLDFASLVGSAVHSMCVHYDMLSRRTNRSDSSILAAGGVQ